MSVGLVTALMFLSLVVALALGLPLAFCLAGIAVVFSLALWGTNSLFIFQSQIFGYTETIILIAVPLFIFMANILERSGISEALYTTMYSWMGKLRGGLAMGTVLICTLFAAMSGTSGAGTVTMGVIALPSMLRRNYKKELAIGSIMGGGALGVLIPPSILMILYAVFAGESVGKMFLGGILPGLALSSLFIIYIGVRCFLNKNLAPPVPKEEQLPSLKDKIIAMRSVILPILLVVLVLGSIFTGLATPTEAAAMGVAGSLVCAAIHRRLAWITFRDASFRSIRLTCMVMFIIIGSAAFTSVYQALGAPQLMEQIIASLPVNRWVILIGMQATFFVLGCFLDPTGIILICTPIFVPVVQMLGFDTLWFGIVFVVNMEMAFLTPPFGFNIFYMKGVVPPGISIGDIYRSTIPFVLLQGSGLVLVMLFPQLATWLPNLLIK